MIRKLAGDDSNFKFIWRSSLVPKNKEVFDTEAIVKYDNHKSACMYSVHKLTKQ